MRRLLPQPGPRSACIAEIIEEDVHHIVEILELIGVQPHLSLPRRARKCEDRGDNMQAVLRKLDAVIDHPSRVPRSRSPGPGITVFKRAAFLMRKVLLTMQGASLMTSAEDHPAHIPQGFHELPQTEPRSSD